MEGRKSNSRARASRRLAVGLAVAGLLIVGSPEPAGAAGEGASRALEISYDLLVLRPLGAAALVMGAGCFALSAPFVAPFEGLDTSWDVFVYAPYEYTFRRKLGSF